MTDNYRAVLEKSRVVFAENEPQKMAQKGGAAFLFYPSFSIREIIIPFLGEVYRVTWPGGEVFPFLGKKEVSFAPSLLILHYLTRASGDYPEGRWLSFKELWGGKSFDAAFQVRSLKPISDHFHNNEQLFQKTSAKLGGIANSELPNSYLFFSFPRLPLLCSLSSGDEEIPSKSTILYDSVANTYLETEDLAVLGEILAERLIEKSQSI